MPKISKQAVLYIHKESDYDCDDCITFIPLTKQCAQHSSTDRILPHGACGLWSEGAPIAGLVPMGCFTPLESGYVENPAGYGCKRCANWLQQQWDCTGVDRDSPGDDPGLIHPDACCNAWKPDSMRGGLSDESLSARGIYMPQAKEW